jgi:hypothetical protein
MRFEVLKALKMQVMVFRVVTPCGLQVEPNVSEEHTVTIFRAEDRDNMFLQNDGIYLQVHMVLQPGRSTSTTK